MSATREEWLTTAAQKLADRFGTTEDIPPVSVGFPPGGSRRVRLYAIVRDSEGSPQVYVTPLLSDPAEVLAVLLYAMAEVSATGTRAANRERDRLGYAPGPGVLPGAGLRALLSSVADELDPYPHVYTDPSVATARTQTTRMLKAECSGGIGSLHDVYIVRLTRTQADRGLPRCGVCLRSMILA